MEWLNYDLHMHGRASKNKDGNVLDMSVSDFIDTMTRNSINVFSITDHNVFDTDYYNKIDKYLDENPNIAIKYIPGAELDILIDLENGKSNYLNILFYFYEKYTNLETSIKELYSNARKPYLREVIDKFNGLNYKYLLVPEGVGERGISNFINKMTPETARYFKIQGIYKIFGGFDKTVKDRFNAEIWALDFYKKSVELNEFVEKYTKDSNIIIDKMVQRIKGLPVVLDSVEEDFINKIKRYSTYLARFKFSDWHNKDTYTNEYYNHIFGDRKKPFDTFELALIDPESRLLVNKNKSVDTDKSFLNSLKFKLKSVEKTIQFTQGLNVIIGGRGSGKSLLHSIIKSLKTGSTEFTKYNKAFQISDIVGTLVNNQQVTPYSNINSIEVIDQQKVEEYFIKHPDLKIFLKENFKKLDQPNLDVFEKIMECLNNIVFDNKVDDNISPILSNIIETNGYLISDSVSLRDYSQVKVLSQNANINNQKLLVLLKSLDYDVNNLEAYFSLLNNELNQIIKNAQLIEDFKLEVSSIVKRYISNSQENINKTQEALSYINEYEKRLELYLYSHFNNVLLSHIITNFYIDVPKATYNYHELGYIFKNRSNLKDASIYKEDIKGLILSSINRANYDNFENELASVIKGEKRLNKDKSPAKIVDDYISKINFDSDLHVYKTKFDLTINDIVLTEDNVNMWLSEHKIESVTEGSLGVKTVAYLDFAFDTVNTILLFDQPEDNIDNTYISNRLVDIIKKKKKQKQMIFVTHNPSIAVYADAFNYIMAENDNGVIDYKTLQITTKESKEKILEILDGGKLSFSNRNNKYGNIIGGIDYED